MDEDRTLLSIGPGNQPGNGLQSAPREKAGQADARAVNLDVSADGKGSRAIPPEPQNESTDRRRNTMIEKPASHSSPHPARRPQQVIGPLGEPLTRADLPPPNTKRWVIRRKAEVVAAVRGGLLSLEEACERYTLTVEEFLSWQSSINDHGLAGLRTTRIQQYRH